MKKMFEFITPEEAGIPSKAILNFIKQLEENEVNIHSFLMLREDKIFVEGYWKPFHKDFQHRMFSIAKSFTGIAIGLLQEDGKLKITDRICDYFPDKIPKEGVSEYISKITIKDMLTMRTAHSKNTYKVEIKNDWVESFFLVKPSHYPGTIFSYDTAASHVLAALVEKLSGKSLMDYLREKVLNYIGFSKEAKFLKDPMGVSQGGSGLICTMRDLAKLAYVCINDGCYNGKQLVPKEYIREATQKQVDTYIQPVIDEQQGYGYLIWKSRHDGFTFYGMGGQLAVCLPQHKIIFITTADTQGNTTGLQNIYDAFWQQVYPFIEKGYEQLPENKESYDELKKKIANLSIKPIDGKTVSFYSNKINGKRYILESNPMNIKSFRITFNNTDCLIEYENDNGKFEIPFALGRIRRLELDDLKIPLLISGAWRSENILSIKVNLIGELLGSIRINIGFNNKNVTISMKKTVEGKLNNYDGIATGTICDEYGGKY